MKVTAGKVLDAVTLGASALYSFPVNVGGCPRTTFTGTASIPCKADIQVSHGGYDESAVWTSIQTVDITATEPLNITIEHQCNHARLAFHDGEGAVVNAWIHGQLHG